MVYSSLHRAEARLRDWGWPKGKEHREKLVLALGLCHGPSPLNSKLDHLVTSQDP